MLFQVVGSMIMGSAPSSIGDRWVVTEKKGSDRLKWSLSIIGFNSPPPSPPAKVRLVSRSRQVPLLGTCKAVSVGSHSDAFRDSGVEVGHHLAG